MRVFFLVLCLWCATTVLAQEPTFNIVDVKLVGEPRTKLDWLKTYLGYDYPLQMTDSDFATIRSKLLTTEVFTNAVVKPEPVSPGSKDYILAIEVHEKWTTIPVVRGAYGGGTPFTVVGVYDTHSFGRLWTLGAEAQRYGEAPWGSVVWARNPRAEQGFHEYGVEAWRQFRIRSIYDDEENKLGELRSDWTMFRLLYMRPLMAVSPQWKYGLDLRYRTEAPTKYRPEDDYPTSKPKGIRMTDRKTRQFNPMLRVIYDDMTVDNLYHDGVRVIANAGPLQEKSEIYARSEIEGFYFYKFAGSNFNLGLHALVGQTTSDTLENQYFIGGFESVRGLPDGVLYGNRAAYTNVELRHITYQFKYLWLQSILFTDSGGAGQRWSEVANDIRTSVGVGVRFAVPQVYRLMFRVDYAWSVDHPGTSGISFGMNQFFQPFKPL